MIAKDSNRTGPGVGEPPAPSILGPACFAGMSARRYGFTLDWRDALAWERLPQELAGRAKAIWIVSILLAGLGYGLMTDLLPPWVARVPELVQVMVVLVLWWGLWALAMAGLQRSRARRRIPLPLAIRVEASDDHLKVDWGGACHVMRPETIRQVVLTPSHVFVEDAKRLLILPIGAFGGMADMAAFADHWQEALRDPEG